MVDFSVHSGAELGLKGSLAVYSVPADVDEAEVLDYLDTPVFSAKNLVVSSATTALVQLLRGNVADYMPAYISIGSGGDFSQTTLLDTGARVGPQITDLGLRAVTARIPIIHTEDGANNTTWAYVAVARPHEAISPIINELGVETRSGTLISHYVTDADDAGRALRYCKTSLEYLVIRWTYELSLTLNVVDTPISEVNEGYFLAMDINGTEYLTAEAIPRAGAATAVALLSQTSDGSAGTIDVQADYTITSQEADGSAATISLTEVSA